jgi:hypothetical protein
MKRSIFFGLVMLFAVVLIAAPPPSQNRLQDARSVCFLPSSQTIDISVNEAPLSVYSFAYVQQIGTIQLAQECNRHFETTIYRDFQPQTIFSDKTLIFKKPVNTTNLNLKNRIFASTPIPNKQTNRTNLKDLATIRLCTNSVKPPYYLLWNKNRRW